MSVACNQISVRLTGSPNCPSGRSSWQLDCSKICASSYLQIQLAIKSGLCPEFVHVCLNFVLHLNGCWASREWAMGSDGRAVQSMLCPEFVHVQLLSNVCPCTRFVHSLSSIWKSPLFSSENRILVQCLSKSNVCPDFVQSQKLSL